MGRDGLRISKVDVISVHDLARAGEGVDWAGILVARNVSINPTLYLFIFYIISVCISLYSGNFFWF